MNIGIIVYTVSGHTLKTAQRLQVRLASDGHQVFMEHLELVGPARVSNEEADLKTNPILENYDTLVFCTPVRGGSPPPPVRRYLSQLASLKGKRAACLVTHAFPLAWGANQTVAALRAACEAKGALYLGMAAVHWFGFNHSHRLEQAVREMCRLLE